MNASKIRVAAPPSERHPSSYPPRGLVSALAEQSVRPLPVPRRTGKALVRLGVKPRRLSDQIIVVPMMGCRFELLYAAAVYGVPVPFCWDVWEPDWPTWVAHLERIEPPLIVVTSSRSAEYLRSRLSASRVEFLPEATTIDAYQPGDALADRSIDVLELGRRNEAWHAAVTPALAECLPEARHLYEARPGELIFADEEGLVAGLAASKVSVCFPSSITHPARSGSVSTMTHRYLESISSRCLVLGQTPPELLPLLGVDPVVGADLHDPWGQLRQLLNSLESYQDMVDDARERLIGVGDWKDRARDLLSLLHSL
jgi:hypothetical protein